MGDFAKSQPQILQQSIVEVVNEPMNPQPSLNSKLNNMLTLWPCMNQFVASLISYY